MLTSLNEQKAASGDAERVRFFVGHLAACCRGTAQVDLHSHDRAVLRTQPDMHHLPGRMKQLVINQAPDPQTR